MLQSLKNGSASHAYCLVGSTDRTNAALQDIITVLAIAPQEQWYSPNQPVSINDVRDLTRWLSKKPFEGQRKIAYLSLIGMRNDAITALLKTLEEPPSYATLIISSPNAQIILPTIKSRCQMVWLGGEDAVSGENLTNSLESFLSLQELVEKTPVSDIIDTWLINIRKSVRQGKSLKRANELLELKKFSQTNVNSRLLAEYAMVQGQEE